MQWNGWPALKPAASFQLFNSGQGDCRRSMAFCLKRRSHFRAGKHFEIFNAAASAPVNALYRDCRGHPAGRYNWHHLLWSIVSPRCFWRSAAVNLVVFSEMANRRYRPAARAAWHHHSRSGCVEASRPRRPVPRSKSSGTGGRSDCQCGSDKGEVIRHRFCQAAVLPALPNKSYASHDD